MAAAAISRARNSTIRRPAPGAPPAGSRQARITHTATLLPERQGARCGGLWQHNALASAELYDPASGTWTPPASLATARAFHTATLLPNGKVLVAGGAN